jgi:hypothetical protein
VPEYAQELPHLRWRSCCNSREAWPSDVCGLIPDQNPTLRQQTDDFQAARAKIRQHKTRRAGEKLSPPDRTIRRLSLT